jgi:hypothetical protein
MSAIADFRIIETEKLEALKEAAEIKTTKGFFSKTVIDNYQQFLELNTTKLSDFQWSGYVFGNLLFFLQEQRNIDLISSEFNSICNWIAEKRKISVMIFTFNHKAAYFDKLFAENFTNEELIQFNKEFSQEDDLEIAQAEKAGIDAIRKSLELLMDNSKVVLLTVG